MSNIIKETPILYGEDAERFQRRMNDAMTYEVPKEEVNRILFNYNKIKRTAK